MQICRAVAVGFAVIGFIGYFVKLIHIPMYAFSFLVLTTTKLFTRNNILVYVFIISYWPARLILMQRWCLIVTFTHSCHLFLIDTNIWKLNAFLISLALSIKHLKNLYHVYDKC